MDFNCYLAICDIYGIPHIQDFWGEHTLGLRVLVGSNFELDLLTPHEIGPPSLENSPGPNSHPPLSY